MYEAKLYWENKNLDPSFRISKVNYLVEFVLLDLCIVWHNPLQGNYYKQVDTAISTYNNKLNHFLEWHACDPEKLV